MLPSVLTTAALCLGLLSIMVSIETVALRMGGSVSDAAVMSKFWWAGVLICLAALFDMLDGAAARLLKTESNFGVYYDSISDLVSFGVAPGVLIFSWVLIDSGRLGIMAVIFYIVCTALRLARFTMQSDSVEKYVFTGLPSPAAAALMITPVLLFAEFSFTPDAKLMWYYLLASPFIGLLMVSEVRYSKRPAFLFRKSFDSLVLLAIIIAALIVYPELMLFVIAYLYGAIGLVRYIVKFLRQGKPHEESQAFGPRD